jgi:hypothetical protein
MRIRYRETARISRGRQMKRVAPSRLGNWVRLSGSFKGDGGGRGAARHHHPRDRQLFWRNGLILLGLLLNTRDELEDRRCL